MSETPQGTWLGGAQRGSLWLRNGEVGSQVSGIDQNLKVVAKNLRTKLTKNFRKWFDVKDFRMSSSN